MLPETPLSQSVFIRSLCSKYEITHFVSQLTELLAGATEDSRRAPRNETHARLHARPFPGGNFQTFYFMKEFWAALSRLAHFPEGTC